MKEGKKYKKGYFIEMGLVIGMPVGIPIGLALGSIAYGPLTGVILGLIAGFILEKKLNKNPVEPSTEQKSRERKFGLISFGLGIMLFVSILLFNIFI